MGQCQGHRPPPPQWRSDKYPGIISDNSDVTGEKWAGAGAPNINLKSKQRNDPRGSRPGYHKRLFRNKMWLINHVTRKLNSSFYFNLSWKWSGAWGLMEWVCVHYIQVLNNNHLPLPPLPPVFNIILTRPLISRPVHFGHVTIIRKRTHTALLHTIEFNREELFNFVGVWRDFDLGI